jgi:hypothetical protein
MEAIGVDRGELERLRALSVTRIDSRGRRVCATNAPTERVGASRGQPAIAAPARVPWQVQHMFFA